MEEQKETTPGESMEAMPMPPIEANIEANKAPEDFQPEYPVLPKWRLIFIALSLCTGLFLSLLDATIVATALLTIGNDLHSVRTVTWVALAYTLADLSFCIIMARLADIVGRRNIWVTSIIIFIGFSIGCGCSKDLTSLIACRVLQGIGGSGLYALTFVIMPEISPPKMTGALGGIAGAVVACAGVLGPVVGGAITQHTTWKWVFWINAPIGAIPLVMFLIAWPKPHMLRPVQKRSIRELDIFGATLVIAASVLFVFSIQIAGIKSNIWNKALFICPLLIGSLCWCLLFGWEFIVNRFWQESFASMFPLRLVKHRIYMAYVISTLLTGFPFLLVVYALPLRFQVVNGKTPLTAGVSLLPMLGATAIGSTIGGALNSKKNNIFPVLVTASCFMVIGTGLMSTLSNTDKVEHKCYGFQVLIGMGFGLTVSTVSIASSLSCDLKDSTVAQGIIAQMRVLGGSIGIAASTAILGVTEHRELITTSIVTDDQLANLQTAAKAFSAAQGHAVKQAFTDAFNEDLRVCAIIAGICVAVTLSTFQKDRKPILERRREQQIIELKRLRDMREMKQRTRETKGMKEAKEMKEIKDTKEMKDTKERKEVKEREETNEAEERKETEETTSSA